MMNVEIFTLKMDEIVRNFKNVEDDVTVMTDDELRDELLAEDLARAAAGPDVDADDVSVMTDDELRDELLSMEMRP